MTSRIMMMRHCFMALIVIGVTTVISMAIFMLLSNINVSLPARTVNDADDPKRSRGLLVDTPACRIPEVDLYDSSIAKLIKPRGKIVCIGKPPITYEDGSLLRINWTTVNTTYKDKFDHCKYQSILRTKYSDFHVTYGSLKYFHQDVKIKDNFIKVKCFNKNNNTIYENLHAFVIPNNATENVLEGRYQRHLQKNKPKEALNVMILGIDSLSRLNFIRQMPRTRNYLLKELEAVELFGYTKVADNTFVNIVPLLAGKFVHELPWGRDKKQTFDEYNFIWKNFSNSGFATFYAEDWPSLSTFHYLKRGFKKPPTDSYGRALGVAMDKHKHLWSNEHNCFGGRLDTDIFLKQTLEFLTTYHDKPYFGFTFLSRLSHDGFNTAGAADEPHFQYLRKFHNRGLFNNTIFIYLSDHGCRIGHIRHTFIGKLEERLPLMYLVFPTWFKKKYPKLIENIKINANRLTTPFDIYETLKDIIYFDGKVKTANVLKRGISLFSKIPRDRSCDNAGILPHWCVCLETEPLSASSKHVQGAAQHIVKHINELLRSQSNVCEKLNLEQIANPVRMGANEEVVSSLKHKKKIFTNKQKTKSVILIQLEIRTKPGDAYFEGTVRLDETSGKYTLVGDISRINKYGDQSHCVSDNKFRKFCYCKDIK